MARRTRLVRRLSATSVLLASLLACEARGQVMNGSFENGLIDWTWGASCGVDSSWQGFPPTDGAQLAVVRSTVGGGIFDSTIEILLGLDPGSLDALGNGDALVGSVLYQTFAVSAGEHFAFDWSFKPDTFPNNDFAFVAIGGGTPIELADAASGTSEIGFQPFCFTAPADGFLTLGFGAMDVGSMGSGAELALDNVRPAADIDGDDVPDPCDLGCGSGIVEPGEQCDDGNALAGDGCSPTCTVETCWQCAGNPSACTPIADGTSCNAAYCTPRQCQAGACEPVGSPCPGLCNEASNTCIGNCPLAPQTCRTAGKSILVIKDKQDDGKDLLNWKWIKGVATSQDDFANPILTASYSLCLYAGTTSALIGEAEVPPHTTKWRTLSAKGFKYKDPGASADGVKKIVVKGGANGKAKAVLKGKGGGLPELALTPPLPEPVTAQLVNTDTSLCWGASYAGTAVLKNEAGAFKGKAE